MDRLVSIPERVLSYKGSKAEERARLRVQRIVSIPVRVLGLPKSSLSLALPYLRSYGKMAGIAKNFFELLILCNCLTNFLSANITVESDEQFQATHRRFMLHLEGTTPLLSNEREWEYRDICLAPVMYAVTTGMAFYIVHFLLDLALRERNTFLFYYRKEKSMQKLSRSKKREPSFFQPPIPFNRQPFLQVKKKLREKESRAAIDGIKKYADLLKFKLEIGAIQSPEAKLEIRQFLETLGLL